MDSSWVQLNSINMYSVWNFVLLWGGPSSLTSGNFWGLVERVERSKAAHLWLTCWPVVVWCPGIPGRSSAAAPGKWERAWSPPCRHRTSRAGEADSMQEELDRLLQHVERTGDQEDPFSDTSSLWRTCWRTVERPVFPEYEAEIGNYQNCPE